MKTIKKYYFVYIFLLFALSGCKFGPNISNEVSLMIEWNREALNTEILTEGIAVPISARFYGFYGLIPLISDSYVKNNFDLIFLDKII